jgi:hypothetical protein
MNSDDGQHWIEGALDVWPLKSGILLSDFPPKLNVKIVCLAHLLVALY